MKWALGVQVVARNLTAGICSSRSRNIIEDVPKHVGQNLVFADDDQQRSRPGRLAKHLNQSILIIKSGLLLSQAGYLTPPVDFVTDFVTDRRTDGRIKGVLGLQ